MEIAVILSAISLGIGLLIGYSCGYNKGLGVGSHDTWEQFKEDTCRGCVCKRFCGQFCYGQNFMAVREPTE